MRNEFEGGKQDKNLGQASPSLPPPKRLSKTITIQHSLRRKLCIPSIESIGKLPSKLLRTELRMGTDA